MGFIAQGHVESSWTRDWTCVPGIGRQILYRWATREVLVTQYFYRLHSIKTCYKVIAAIPCDRQYMLIVYLFHTYCLSFSYILVCISWTPHPCFVPFPSLSLWISANLFFVSVSLFCIYTHVYDSLDPHISAITGHLSFSGWLISFSWSSPTPSMWLQMAKFHSF